MFLDFWKMREQPFGVTPDPRYLYFSAGHREALATLFCGIETGRGFLSLIAPPGMGKTTLLFQLLQRLKGYVHTAFLFQTQCDSRELIRYLLDDLGLKTDGEDMVRMHSDLNDFLFRETKAGRRVVVLIDEAQNLSDTVLETVRLLSNFEATDKKLLQIVLAGQPELAQRLSRPGLAQLRQRIAVQARLDPLPASEIVRYVNHRLQVAGYEGTMLFTPGAFGIVAELSRGVPRLINILCFNALSLGFAMRREQINSEIVREAAKDMILDIPVPIPKAQQSQTAQRPAPRVRSSWQSFGSWARDGVVRRRLVPTSALSLLLGSAAIYLGAHSRAVTLHASTTSKGNPPSVAASSGPESPAPRSVLGPSGDTGPQQPGHTDVREKSTDSFIHVVQPHDTVRDLCMSTFGRYDNRLLLEIQRLNPGLSNPNHLEVGQEIRLPLSSQK